MRDEDAVDGEMRRAMRARPADLPPLDGDTAERMLVGELDPGDCPPGYADVVRTLAAAAAAPAAEELAGEAAAVATYRSARRPFEAPRRSSVIGRLLSAKALAGLIVGAVSVGTAAAAATGSLPAPAQRVAHRLLGGAGVPAPETPRSTAGPLRPETSLPGAVGLCQAWRSGQGGQHGDKLDSAAFERLATAAGGATKVPGFCAAVRNQHQTEAAEPAGSPAAGDGLPGLCTAWLAHAADGRAPSLGQPALLRLTTAAGGASRILAFCATTAAHPASRPAPSASPTPSGHSGQDRGQGQPPSQPSPHPTPHP